MALCLLELTVRLPKLILQSCFTSGTDAHSTVGVADNLRVFRGRRGLACSVGLNLQCTYHKGQRDLNENFVPSFQRMDLAKLLQSWSNPPSSPSLHLSKELRYGAAHDLSAGPATLPSVGFSSTQQLCGSVGMRHSQSLRALKGFYHEASGMF